ncbi:MAG: hypothetical protein KC543_13795, partial [Myxococcales bacterium]|nr:hypothetical protein [Myxococcales bacterium]
MMRAAPTAGNEAGIVIFGMETGSPDPGRINSPDCVSPEAIPLPAMGRARWGSIGSEALIGRK